MRRIPVGIAGGSLDSFTTAEAEQTSEFKKQKASNGLSIAVVFKALKCLFV